MIDCNNIWKGDANIKRDLENKLISLTFGTILRFIKVNNFDTRHLNRSRHLFLSFYCATWRIYEPLHVFEPGFNTNKYGTIDGEKSAGLNVHFSTPLKFSRKYFRVALARSPYYLCSTIKERHLYSWESFSSTLENRDNWKMRMFSPANLSQFTVVQRRSLTMWQKPLFSKVILYENKETINWSYFI